MLHVLFASAQLWGSYNFYKMYKKQERLMAIDEGRSGDEEASPKEEMDSNKKTSVVVNSMDRDRSEQPSRDGSEVELTLNPPRRTAPS